MKLKFEKPKKRNKRQTRWKKGLDGKQHIFLYGQEAHLYQRMEVYRLAGGRMFIDSDGLVHDIVPAICTLCKPSHPVGWLEGHWAHLEQRHCDCPPPCTIFCCKAAHAKLHHFGREFL